MNISNSILVNTHYTRSIHLERDASSEDVIGAYIPTSRALSILKGFSRTLKQGTVPRSWALTGPYGSGKSSFAVFLSHLLENPDSATSRLARDVLAKADPLLATAIDDQLRDTIGHCRILLTGNPEPLAKRLLYAIYEGAKSYWGSRRGRTPLVIKNIEQAMKDECYSTHEIIALIKSLRAAVSKSGGSGILIIIDELGKFLEIEARNLGTNDIYLLQAIAELACDKGSAPVHFFVLLHQSFHLYAKGLGEDLKKEWQKVQGRFESVPFLESVEQTLRVIRAAFSYGFDSEINALISQELHPICHELENADALPGTLVVEDAVSLFSGCYPIHPVALLMLPLLCQHVAQNERTLFSYLGSREPYGLNDSIARLNSDEAVLPWVYPWEVYEYFLLNQQVAASDQITHRRWAEVITAVERLDGSLSEELMLTKTIGLLNIIGAKSGMKASIGVLENCVPFDKERLAVLLEGLQEKSIISYRKYSGEYRVWQGSDFDLEDELQKEIESGKALELVDELNGRNVISPIVARRYTIETGTLRYYSPLFADIRTIGCLEDNASEPRVLFLLAETPFEHVQLLEKAMLLSDEMTVTAVCSLGAEVKQAVQETLALERIIRNNSMLNGDPVAQRELKERLSASRGLEKQLLESITGNPEKHEWFYIQNKIHIRSRRALQAIFSNILIDVYNKAPIIKNELVNRGKPSSSAISGRNKLFVAMLDHADQKNLGIDKFPPEKAIYKSIMEATGLHVQHEGGWMFSAPASDDLYNFKPIWNCMLDFFERSEAEALSLSELFEELERPPYGIKAGVIPILFMASYLANQHELALYEEREFCPVVSHEVVERMVRHPKAFAVQRFRISGMRVSVYKQYMEMVTGSKHKKLDLIGLVKPLAKFMNSLPEHVKRTKRISKEGQSVRRVFFSAKSPASLLFEDIPTACGFHKFNAEDADQAQIKDFSEKFIGILKELKDTYPSLLRLLKTRLAEAFPDSKAEDIHEFRQNLHGRFIGLERYTVDTEGVKAFTLRLCDGGFESDLQWLESLAAFLGRKPADKWNDDDLRLAEFRLAEFSGQLHDLELLRVSHEKNKLPMDVNFDSTLIRLIRQGESIQERVVHTDEKKREAYQGVVKKVTDALDGLDESMKLAMLTDILNSTLRYNAQENKSSKTKQGKSVKK